MSARVRIELDNPSTTADLTRFLSLLAMLGVDPEEDWPIRLDSSPGGVTRTVAASLPLDYPFRGSDEDDES